ncbi:MAG TPA: SIMPL domain-containing protein [Candidatus Limnocylindria bacterium]|nr:SIMPL domain-containing protein [Candidatus Limnocylindria bacterium]
MRGLAAIALLLAGCAAPVALEQGAPRVISVSAVGRVTVKPDTALVQIGPESRARALAVRAAAAKAAEMAAAAGVRLGALVLLSEGGGLRPLMPQGRYTAVAQSAHGPVEPGQLELEVAVEAQYLIER